MKLKERILVDVQEITKKATGLLQMVFDDPEHFEQHFESLHNYLEGLSDLSTNPIDKGVIPLFQLDLIILRAIISIKKQQDKKNDEFNSNINNLLSRLGQVEKELKSREDLK